ncbi:MAG: carboxypeptidase regulatory-like domain-containing protein [Planctomycetes bacterium]|nr:carboxypeptidase regulatory-like domain-containing protein [Planctomycetota bacterium]
MGNLMSQRWIASLCVALFATTLITSCGGDKPERNKEYDNYSDVKNKGKSDASTAVEDSGDGDFGPTGGKPATTSCDEIMTKVVANSGQIKGQIKYKGTPRKPAAIDMSKDKWCSDTHSASYEDLLVSDGGGLENVVVYVSKGFNDIDFDAPTEPVLLDQRGCVYIPHVVCGVVGQDIKIRNSDDTSHNYNFTSRKNPAVNKTQPTPSTNTESLFEKSDMSGNFQCDIHGWMKAPVRVFSHPYFAVTDAEGNFEIKNLPAGSYQVSFLHERENLTSAAQTVTVSAGQAAAVTATMGG